MRTCDTSGAKHRREVDPTQNPQHLVSRRGSVSVIVQKNVRSTDQSTLIQEPSRTHSKRKEASI